MTDPRDDDALAGEYVLGTLDGEELATAAARAEREPAFAALVRDWEHRLAPLSEAVAGSEPPVGSWPAILARIAAPASLEGAADRQADTARILHLSRQVARWRRVTAVISALAAVLALWVAVGPALHTRGGEPTMIAVLMKGGDEPAYFMRLSARDDALAVRAVSAKVPEGHSLELWAIDPALGRPRALGLLDDGESLHKLPADIPPDAARRATYAVTVEPPGGSPTGAPSGAPLFLGHVVAAP